LLYAPCVLDFCHPYAGARHSGGHDLSRAGDLSAEEEIAN